MIDFDTKHPTVLNARLPVVRMFLIETHENYHQQSVEYVSAPRSDPFSETVLPVVISEPSCGLTSFPTFPKRGSETDWSHLHLPELTTSDPYT